VALNGVPVWFPVWSRPGVELESRFVAVHISLVNGKGFDVEGEFRQVAGDLQPRGAGLELAEFTATISGRHFAVLVNPAHVVFVADATGQSLRSA
jgi:hypothetical protein